MSIGGTWVKEPCSECGEEGYSSRTQPRDPEAGPYICEGCEMYQRGYEDGQKHAVNVKTYGPVLKRDVKRMRLANMLSTGYQENLIVQLQAKLISYQDAQRSNMEKERQERGMDVLEHMVKIQSELDTIGKLLNQLVLTLLFDNVVEE